jgi:hypothetical protein
MSKKSLSSVANDVIAAYGITATNVINSYRFGGERLVAFVDGRFADVVERGVPALGKGVRTNLIDTQQRVSGYYVKGVHLGTERAQSVVGTAIDLAAKSVSLIATGAERLDRATGLNALDTLNRVAMPAATVVSQIAERLEEGSSELVKRVSGTRMPAKAVATRKLAASKRQAAATRRRVVKTATREVNEFVAGAATETSNAARRVARKARSTSQQVNAAVTDAATETSNTARRVAREARSTSRRVGTAVADAATETSNAARRVARKAKAQAEAVATA